MYLFVHICYIYQWIFINNHLNNSLRFICLCMCYFKRFCCLSAKVRTRVMQNLFFIYLMFVSFELLFNKCLFIICMFIFRLHAGGLFGYAVSFHAQRWWAYICAFITIIWHALEKKKTYLKNKVWALKVNRSPFTCIALMEMKLN